MENGKKVVCAWVGVVGADVWCLVMFGFGCPGRREATGTLRIFLVAWPDTSG